MLKIAFRSFCFALLISLSWLICWLDKPQWNLLKDENHCERRPRSQVSITNKCHTMPTRAVELRWDNVSLFFIWLVGSAYVLFYQLIIMIQFSFNQHSFVWVHQIQSRNRLVPLSQLLCSLSTYNLVTFCLVIPFSPELNDALCYQTHFWKYNNFSSSWLSRSKRFCLTTLPTINSLLSFHCWILHSNNMEGGYPLQQWMRYAYEFIHLRSLHLNFSRCK